MILQFNNFIFIIGILSLQFFPLIEDILFLLSKAVDFFFNVTDNFYLSFAAQAGSNLVLPSSTNISGFLRLGF